MSSPISKYCKCPVYHVGNLPFNGNTVNSSITNAIRFSQLVRYRGYNYGSVRIIPNNINDFGYSSGAPSGYGAPPRNSF